MKLYQVDAFTDRLFSGNPAAVCVMDKWIDISIMQSLAAENNLAETAFVVNTGKHYEIRWFTPTTEVALCGHATLAAAYVLFHILNAEKKNITFNSKSGFLNVTMEDEILFLDFPSDILYPIMEKTLEIEKCIGVLPEEVYRGKFDFLAVVKSEDVVRNIRPVYDEIQKLDARGLIITSAGKEVDFVSRFFAPQSGVNEDPVTGSAHTSLIPLWSGKSGKLKMTASQVSKRGGQLICEFRGERCIIGGKCRLYMTGEINLS